MHDTSVIVVIVNMLRRRISRHSFFIDTSIRATNVGNDRIFHGLTTTTSTGNHDTTVASKLVHRRYISSSKITDATSSPSSISTGTSDLLSTVTVTKTTTTDVTTTATVPSSSSSSSSSPIPHPLVGDERVNAIRTLNEASKGSPFQWEDVSIASNI
jgi:hypothetical protein